MSHRETLARAYAAYRTGDLPVARRLYEQLASEGDLESQVFVGWLLFSGEMGYKEPDTATRWLEQAARQGSSRAEIYLGHIALESGDFSSAQGWFERAKVKNDLAGVYWLGRLAVNGQSSRLSEQEGWTLIEKAAERGHILARKLVAWRRIRSGGLANVVFGLWNLLLAMLKGVLLAIFSRTDDRIRF